MPRRAHYPPAMFTVAVLSACAVALFAAAGVAYATFPGENDKMVLTKES